VSSRAEVRGKGPHHPVVRLGCTSVSCARACVVAVEVHRVFFASTLSKRAVMVAISSQTAGVGADLWRGREESTGTSKLVVEVKNFSQGAGSKASLALEGRMVASQESGFQNRSRAFALSACSSNPFITTRRVDSGTVALCFWGRWSWRCSSNRVPA
jgi:hypothetical protein